MTPEIRALFPGAEERVYLDISARCLVPDPVREAAETHLGIRQTVGGDKVALRAGVERARTRFAELVHAAADEIAITKNVSEGLNLFAASLPWESGDNVVVCPELEHPNNIYLWYNLRARKGVEVRAIPAERGRIPVSAMRAAMDARTRVVTLPSISFAPGFISDVAGVSAAARRAGAWTLVDAAQSVGAIRTDVDALGIDALAVATQKCMLGLYGTGFLYIRRDVAERLLPIHVARYGIDLHGAHETAFSEDDLRYRPGALRFDLGNYNYLGAAAAGAAIELLLGWGMQRVEVYLRGLSARLAAGFRELDLPVVGGAPGPHLAHIVSVGRSGGGRHYTADDPAMNELHRHLMDGGVHHSIRSGVLRFSVGVYNDTDDVERVLELAEEWVRRSGYRR
ncbi:MAG: aminotransferase class V-fold PLP-dependent enzyme [Longimicrobiales bacterium]|nr:aminotransferase class V-fold PLP-dependent enzyme [Longimicrobiales bacterium]